MHSSKDLILENATLSSAEGPGLFHPLLPVMDMDDLFYTTYAGTT